MIGKRAGRAKGVAKAVAILHVAAAKASVVGGYRMGSVIIVGPCNRRACLYGQA